MAIKDFCNGTPSTDILERGNYIRDFFASMEDNVLPQMWSALKVKNLSRVKDLPSFRRMAK